MDHSRLVADAWRLTWRHRFLWAFGLFAGGSGCNFNFRTGGLSPGRGSPVPAFGPGAGDLQRFLAEAAAWAASHVGLLVAVAVAALLLALVGLVLHFIAEGALIAALAALAAGEPTSLWQAWTRGRHLAWTYVRLWLALLGLGLGVLVLVALAVVFLVRLGQAIGPAAVAIGLLLLLPALAVGIPLAIAVYIVVSYAERAIAVDGTGALEALGRGKDLLVGRLGPTLLLWLVSVLVAIGILIVLGIAALVLLVPAGLLLYSAYSAWGLSAPTLTLAALALVAVGLVLWAVSAVTNTFGAAYWTLGYLAMTDRYQSQTP